MIANCIGCECERDDLQYYSSKYKSNFASKGLYEKGHLVLILVNDKGEIIVG